MIEESTADAGIGMIPTLIICGMIGMKCQSGWDGNMIMALECVKNSVLIAAVITTDTSMGMMKG